MRVRMAPQESIFAVMLGRSECRDQGVALSRLEKVVRMAQTWRSARWAGMQGEQALGQHLASGSKVKSTLAAREQRLCTQFTFNEAGF